MKMSDHKTRSALVPALLWLVCVSLFCLTAYGGIRTPDGEVVFRTGEALARHGTVALDNDLEAWPEFGLPVGKDGRRYSLFGPVQSILLAPFIRAAQELNQNRWYEHRPIPISFAVDRLSFRSYILKQRPANMEPHALRFLVALFVPLVASIVVILQFLIVRRLTGHWVAAFITALLLGLGTPLWHYSGTMFTEPLAMAFSLAAFLLLLPSSRGGAAAWRYSATVVVAGLLLGLACATHISAILSVPFFFLFAMPARSDGNGTSSGRVCSTTAVAFLAGICLITIMYGWYNHMRFGSVFETGRTAASPVVYDVFTAPWEGLAGLLISPGKGIFWFCPVLIVSLFWWPRFHRRYRWLSSVVIGMVLLRLIFFACRSNWHSGFCLGTRYILLVLPFLLLPVGFRLADFFTEDRRVSVWRPAAVGLLLFACIVQQLYFCLGEPISFYYMLKMVNLQHGISIIENNQIYFQWGASPLLHLFDGRRGPFFLQAVPLGQWGLLALCVLGMALLLGLLTFYLIHVNRKLYK